MASVNIEDLFDNHRFPSGLGLIAVVLYFPIGLALSLLRFFIGFHAFLAACLLPKASTIRSTVMRTMCGVLGIFVTQSESEQRDKQARVIVANYTTALDHLAVGLVLPNVLPSVWDLPPMLMWLLGYTDMGAKKGRETLIRNVKSHCQTSPIPILAFPEGASTNGKTGLLKFSVWPFSLNQSVQPIIIKVSRPPFARISPSVLGGRWWIDVFWFLFVPYTLFHIKVLPSISQGAEESKEDFTRRGQHLMTKALDLEPTTHTSADKVEYAKRKLFVSGQSANRPSSLGGPAGSVAGANENETTLMCHQVKEVLPHVPLDVIRTNLALTKDVDLTITNLLEGNIEYEPVEEGVEASPANSPSPQPRENTPPKSFGKTYKERHLTFEERKKCLIENARRRYLEKHGMIA